MRNGKAWGFVIVIALLALIGLSHLSGNEKILNNLSLYLNRLIDDHYLAAVLVYIIAMVIATSALALPGAVFAAIAGLLFGPWWGTLWCTIAASAGSMVSFFVGRFFLQEALSDRISQNKLLSKWLSGEHSSVIIVLAVTRLVPVFPYNLQNFAYGATKIRFGTYAFWSTLFLIPGTAAYTFIAGGILSEENQLLYIAAGSALFALVALVAFFLRKRFVFDSKQSTQHEESI